MAILKTEYVYLSILDTVNRAPRPIHRTDIVGQIEKEWQKWFVLTDAEWEQLQEKYDDGQTKFENELYWGLSYLYISGLLQKPKRAYYEITEKGREFLASPGGLVDFVAQKSRKRQKERGESKAQAATAAAHPEGISGDWRGDLLDTLQSLSPVAFERLCKKLLEVAGLTQVELTEGSGDDGIDGSALIDMAGLVRVTVLFQCKRYAGSVAPRIVRDFRGAIGGSAETGILFTTGRFSDKAQAEAERVGTTPIHLIDGELLIDKIKELDLGVNVKTKTVAVEEVEIDKGWFGSL